MIIQGHDEDAENIIQKLYQLKEEDHEKKGFQLRMRIVS